MSRGAAWALAAAALVWAAVAVPLAAGRRTLFYRDVFTTHLPYKAFGAQELRAGRIPATNPTWALGQPFRGNPGTLAFYPGNLLYLLLPFWSAFNLHFALHWLLAMLTMWVLARELGQGPEAAALAGLTYAGCGWVLSCLTFYNLLVVAAWWPLALAGAARGGRRGIALGGVAAGMALLGGEPVTAAVGLVPLLAVAVGRHGPARGLATAGAIGLLALAVALPQVVATLRVLPHSVRGARAFAPPPADPYALAPLRLLELLLPLPFGRPGELGATGYWAAALFPKRIPFVLTLYSGIVGLLLAAVGLRRRWGWAALAGAGLALAWLGGLPPLAFVHWSGGLFRYPEKLVFWTALALPLLAGWGLERSGERRRGWAAAALGCGAASLLAAAALAAAAPRVAAWLEPHVDPERGAAAATTQVGLWVAMLAAAAALLLGAALALRRGSRAALVALQLLALLQLHPLILTDRTAPYRRPGEWAGRLRPGAAVLSSTISSPLGHPAPVYWVPETTDAFQIRLAAADLDAAPGVLHGFTYPLALDTEGLATPYYGLLRRRLPRLGWPARVSWFRRLGIEAAVLVERPAVAGLELVERTVRFGVPTYLYRIREPAPAAWWPARIEVAPTPAAALTAAGAADPLAVAFVPWVVEHRSGGTLRAVAAGPDRIDLEADSPGGVAVLRRAYHPLWRARTAAGERLATLPADLLLLGLEVPPGRHRITLEISARPELLAAALALAALVGALAVLAAGAKTLRPGGRRVGSGNGS